MFEGVVNIGVDSNGNKHFYEINKIKEANDITRTSSHRSFASNINNSISDSNENFNTTIKYSMQENPKYAKNYMAQTVQGENSHSTKQRKQY